MTGGGTGGHVNPAIAIADKIKIMEPDSDIAFVGTPRGIENKIVPAAGYRLYHVDIRGLKRSFSLENLRTAALMVKSHHEARKLLKLFKPDLVFGTGGYVCWPVVRAASEMGIPTALQLRYSSRMLTASMSISSLRSDGCIIRKRLCASAILCGLSSARSVARRRCVHSATRANIAA